MAEWMRDLYVRVGRLPVTALPVVCATLPAPCNGADGLLRSIELRGALFDRTDTDAERRLRASARGPRRGGLVRRTSAFLARSTIEGLAIATFQGGFLLFAGG
jgi:hypothetical protein